MTTLSASGVMREAVKAAAMLTVMKVEVAEMRAEVTKMRVEAEAELAGEEAEAEAE